MARHIHYMAPVDYMSGKLAQTTDKAGQQTYQVGKFFIANNRSYASVGQVRKFFSLKERSVQNYTSAQLNQQQIFKQAAEAVKAIMLDPGQKAAATAQWKSQQPNTKATLRGYLMAIEISKLLK